MVTRIGPRKPSRLYLKEWREKAGLTQEQLADRIDTTKGTISRWENDKAKSKEHRAPSDDALTALAEALDIEKQDLFRDPERPSIDALLRMVPDSKQLEIIEVVKVLIKQAS